MTSHRARIVSGGLFLATVAGLTTCIVLAHRDGDAAGILPFLPTMVTFAVVGALISARRSTNPIGWLFLGFALMGAVGLTAQAVAGSVGDATTASTTVSWAAWVNMVYVEIALTPMLLAILLFPTGRPISPRWNWTIWFTLAVGLLGASATGLSDANFHANFDFPDPLTPLPVAVLGPIYGIYQFLGLAWMLVVVASLWVRYRRAGSLERQQIKWVLLAVGVMVAGFVVFAVTNIVGDNVVLALIFFAPLIPVAVAIAIFRYRLFDIDRIISRTTSYAIVTGLLVATFAVVVALSSSLFGPKNQLGVALATLIAAALARPVLSRVQRVVDRRFDRTKYDGQVAVDAFGSRLASEVDSGAVITDLRHVVATTVQPASVQVWVSDLT
jgi:MFS family permease